MGKWIEMRNTQIPPKKVEEHRGAFIRLLVSPYDVPLAARGHYEERSRSFVIELKYMDSNEPTEQRKEEGLRLTIGKRSGRIYSIDIDVDRLEVGAVGLRIAVPEHVSSVLARRGNTEVSGAPNARAIDATLRSTDEIYRELGRAAR